MPVFRHPDRENSFGYIASWSKDKELKELRASLETINKTSCELINDIERNYKEICKERGIDLTAAPEPERDPIEQLAADIDQFTFDYDPYEYRNNADSREDALHELDCHTPKRRCQRCTRMAPEYRERGRTG